MNLPMCKMSKREDGQPLLTIPPEGEDMTAVIGQETPKQIYYIIAA